MHQRGQQPVDEHQPVLRARTNGQSPCLLYPAGDLIVGVMPQRWLAGVEELVAVEFAAVGEEGQDVAGGCVFDESCGALEGDS